MKLCFVKECRFSGSHVTRGHRCGGCNLYGHGILECHRPHKKYLLEQKHGEDQMPEAERCGIQECASAYHSTDAHHCSTCGNRGKDNCCVATKLYRKCPTCRVSSTVDLSFKLFTGGNCVVCMESVPCIVFECMHANVCAECVVHLDAT